MVHLDNSNNIQQKEKSSKENTRILATVLYYDNETFKTMRRDQNKKFQSSKFLTLSSNWALGIQNEGVYLLTLSYLSTCNIMIMAHHILHTHVVRETRDWNGCVVYRDVKVNICGKMFWLLLTESTFQKLLKTTKTESGRTQDTKNQSLKTFWFN